VNFRTVGPGVAIARQGCRRKADLLFRSALQPVPNGAMIVRLRSVASDCVAR